MGIRYAKSYWNERHYIKNTASGIVMAKCGMQLERTLRKVLKNNKGELVDCRCYSHP